MKTRPLVVLGAAITADGKLDTTLPPTALLQFFAPQPGDVIVSDNPPIPLAGSWRQVTVDEHEDLAERLRGLRTPAGVPQIFCVGGPALFRRLLDGKLVDELYLLVRPKIDGRRTAATLSGAPGEFFSASIRCRLSKMEVREDQCLLRYRVRHTPSKRAPSA